MITSPATSTRSPIHEPACSAGFPACGFTGLSSPVDQERATGKSPGPAGSKACATNSSRFMVPMRAKYDVEATHEPWLVWSPAFRRLERLGPAEAGTPSCQRFMVPMRDIKVVEATHEPLFPSEGCQPAVSPIADRRGKLGGTIPMTRLPA